MKWNRQTRHIRYVNTVVPFQSFMGKFEGSNRGVTYCTLRSWHSVSGQSFGFGGYVDFLDDVNHWIGFHLRFCPSVCLSYFFSTNLLCKVWKSSLHSDMRVHVSFRAITYLAILLTDRGIYLFLQSNHKLFLRLLGKRVKVSDLTLVNEFVKQEKNWNYCLGNGVCQMSEIRLWNC